MNVWVAFLRGVNLGQRQMKMAELKACLDDAGFLEVKTILASGNVRFVFDGLPADLRERVESCISQRFAFPVRVVLRSQEQLLRMLANHPFAQLDPAADVTRHVLMFDRQLPAGLTLQGLPGHTEILRVDAQDIYIAGYRQPNGRYTEAVSDVLKPLYARLGRDCLDTMRNWNTIEKVLK